MNKNKRAKYDMYLLLRAYMVTVNPSVFLLMPFFTGWYDSFLLKVTELIGYINNQERHRLGFAIYKANCRVALEDGLKQLIAILQVYASATDNAVLFNEVKYSDSDIKKLNDTDLSAVAANVGNWVEENIADLGDFGVTAGTQVIYFGKVDAFNLAKTQPRDEIYDKKESTVAIDLTCKMIDGLLANMDRSVKTVRISQAQFYTQFLDRRKVINPSTRLQAARGELTDSLGNPLPRVRIECEALNIKRRSSKKGRFIIKHAPEGVWKFVFTYPGMEPVVVDVIIANATRAQVNVVMH